MARIRYAREQADYEGPTKILTVRVPVPIADFIDSCVGKDGLPTRTAVLVDALVHWCIEEEADV